MNSPPASAPRPVSLVVVLAIMGCFALFFVLMYFCLLPHPSVLPRYGAAEKLPEDQRWSATAGGRKAYLADLRSKQEKQAATYAWLDQKTGVVQLPIDRAMELVVQDYNKKK